MQNAAPPPAVVGRRRKRGPGCPRICDSGSAGKVTTASHEAGAGPVLLATHRLACLLRSPLLPGKTRCGTGRRGDRPGRSELWCSCRVVLARRATRGLPERAGVAPCAVCTLRPWAAALARCMWACAVLASDVESVCLPRESNAPSRSRRGARGSRPGSGRTVDEPHRAASQLELVFDLTFVVAVAAVVTPARSRSGRAGVRRRSLLQVFFASWWWTFALLMIFRRLRRGRRAGCW